MAFDSNDRRCAYRPFAPEDFEPVAELFYRQWGTEAGERLGRLDARINVCNYLMDADWGVVAEGVDGRLLGALLVETGAQTEAMRSSWRTRREELLAQVAPGATFGHEVCRVEAEELALSRRFREKAAGQPEAAAEFKLLIVGSKARGLGVGGGLLRLGENHLRQAGARGYYLITDDTCDVGFYDHLGLSRLVTEASVAEVGVNLYIYGREFSYASH